MNILIHVIKGQSIYVYLMLNKIYDITDILIDEVRTITVCKLLLP